MEVPSQGPLYLAHIIPNSVPGRAVQWAHSAIRPMKIKYFLARKGNEKRIKMESTNGKAGKEGNPLTGLEVQWGELRTTEDVLDALLIYIAVSFTLRPWDWTGLTIYRVLHEEGYFGCRASSREHQKELCEALIDMTLGKTRARLQQGKPPCDFMSIKKLAINLTGVQGLRESENHEMRYGPWDVYG